MQGPGEDGAGAGAAAADGGVRTAEPIETQSKFAERLRAKIDALDPEDQIQIWRWRHDDQSLVAVFIALATSFGLKLERTTGARTLAVDVTGPRNMLELFRDHAWVPLRSAIRESVDQYLAQSVCPEAKIEFRKDAYQNLPEVTREVKDTTRRIDEP